VGIVFYTNRKISLMYSTTLHKIITIFLKGQFTIYIKKLLGSPLYYDMVLSR